SQTNTADAFKGHVIPATSEETIFAEQSEHFDAPQASPTNTTPHEDNAFPSTPFTPPPHASPRPRVAAAAPPSNTDTGIETQPPETIPGDAPSLFTSDSHPAADAEHESITPATSRATGAAGEARVLPEERRQSRAASEEEIRSDEAEHITEHITVVTKHAPVAASDGERPSVTPNLLTVEWSPAPLHEETTGSAAPRAGVVPALEGTTTTRAANMTTTDIPPVAPGTSPVRGVAVRHERPAPVFHVPPEEDSPRRLESDPASAVESNAAREGESVRAFADSTPYTLEAHVEQLRALMQTTHAEAPSGTGESAAGESATGAARLAVAGTEKEKETRTRHAPARHTRESPRGESRAEFAARPSAASSPKSDSRQSVVLESPQQLGAARGRRTSVAEPPSNVSPVAAGPKNVAGAATQVHGGKRPTGHASPARASGSHAVAPARVGVTQPREGGRQSEITAGGARTPKLTINRLDVQVVNRAEQAPAPPARPAPPTPSSTSQTDPWGAPDRHFLGRFFY
ncbi:MAG TPA: hypothetical protein VFS10_19795, partial [Pyrinomonadaceae bacterium]|nr:hypothetical protein [Pyrinomonadaceae bacterium]